METGNWKIEIGKQKLETTALSFGRCMAGGRTEDRESKLEIDRLGGCLTSTRTSPIPVSIFQFPVSILR
jgi:hypothetical protein